MFGLLKWGLNWILTEGISASHIMYCFVLLFEWRNIKVSKPAKSTNAAIVGQLPHVK